MVILLSRLAISSGERLEGFVVVVVVFLLYSVYMFNPGIDTMKLLF